MFIYALAKGIQKGYLDTSWAKRAEQAFAGLLRHRIVIGKEGPHLTYCNAVAGLGNTPYRDGSYEYYIGERITEDDPKAVGPFMQACVEMQKLTRPL